MGHEGEEEEGDRSGRRARRGRVTGWSRRGRSGRRGRANRSDIPTSNQPTGGGQLLAGSSTANPLRRQHGDTNPEGTCGLKSRLAPLQKFSSALRWKS